MAVYHICNASAASGSTTLTVTVGSGAAGPTYQAPGSGDLIWLLIGDSSSQTVVTVTDSQGQTYLSQVANGAGTQRTAIYALLNTKTLVSGTDTFTVTWSGTGGSKYVIVKGCDGIVTGDKTNGATGTSTAPSSGGSGTLSQAFELVTGVILDANAGGTPTGFSFGTPLTISVASSAFLSAIDEFTSATTTQAASATIVSAGWGACVATFTISALSVTTTSVPGGVVGTPYTQQIAKANGTSGFTWAETSGGLAGSGLSLGSGGSLHGTPTTAGTYSFTAQVTDGAGQVASKALTVTITGGGGLAITTASPLPGGVTSSVYSMGGNFAASGGTSPYKFSVSSGSMPPGLVFSPGGGGTRAAGVTIADSTLAAIKADYTFWNANIYTATHQKIYTHTVGSFAIPANLSSASAEVQAAVAKGTACVLCYKPTANGSSNDPTWPGGANKPAMGNSGTPGTILGDLHLLILSVQAYQAIGVTVAGICLYQESDGHKRGIGGDGLTDPVTQIPYLNYQYYPTLHSTFPTIPVILIHVGYKQNSDSPPRSDYMPCPTQITSPRQLAAAVSTGGSFGAGTYFWRVAATDGWGRVYASNEVSLAISGTQSAALTWVNPGSGANAASDPAKAAYTQIQVFRGTVKGAETTLVTTLGAGATSFTDTGGAGTAQTLTPSVYIDAIGVDLYGDAFDAQTTASKGRYVYSDNPNTNCGYADIADWNGLSFGWTESGNTVGGNPTVDTVTNYLVGNPASPNSTVSSLKNSIQAVYAARVAAGLPNFPYMWYENIAASGGNQITQAGDYRIALLQAIDAAIASGTTTTAITGTPTAAGNYSFTIGVKDSATPANTATKAFTLTVTGAAPALTITSLTLPDAQAGLPYSVPLTSANGTAPVTWTQPTGTLPPGITMDTTGNLAGTTTSVGQFTFKVKVTDSAGKTASATLTLTVDPAPLPPPPVGPSLPPVKPWRFIIAAPQPAGTWLAEVSQAQARTLTLRTAPDQFSEASVDILGADPAAQFITELQSDIQVLLGGTILFCGRVGACADQLDAASQRFQPTAVDYREVLRRRDFAYGGGPNWTNTDVADIVWGILKNGPAGDSQGVTGIQAYPGGNLGIARGLGRSGLGITQTISYGLYQTAGDVITQLAQMTPGSFDWDITPYGASDLRVDLWAPNRGADRGVVLEYGGSLVSSIQRTTDPSTFANSVTVTGQTTAGVQLRNTPSPGSAAVGGFALDASDITVRPEGRWDQVVGTQISSNTGNPGALDAFAAFALGSAEVVTPSYQIQLYPGAWQGISHIWLGDFVTVRIQSGRLNVNNKLRVAEMAFTIDANGLETLTVTLGQVPWRIHQKIPRILRRLRNLESE